MNNFLEFKTALQRFIRTLNHCNDLITPCGFKIHPNQAHSLMYLSQSNGEVNQNELVDFLGIDKSNVARLCEALEKNSFIIRKKSNFDKRSYSLELSAKGKKIASKIEKSSKEYIENILNHIPKFKQSEIIELLTILTKASSRMSEEKKA